PTAPDAVGTTAVPGMITLPRDPASVLLLRREILLAAEIVLLAAERPAVPLLVQLRQPLRLAAGLPCRVLVAEPLTHLGELTLGRDQPQFPHGTAERAVIAGPHRREVRDR